jgi:response regulator RpfG family c-di-GMP phosphodiesterase
MDTLWKLLKSGLEALSKLEVKSYSAALIDVILPDINGLDFLNRLKVVAPVDPEALRDRTEAMRGVKVSVPFHRMGSPPDTLSFHIVLYLAEVVKIPAFGVKEFPEYPLRHHIQYHHLNAVIIARFPYRNSLTMNNFV